MAAKSSNLEAFQAIDNMPRGCLSYPAQIISLNAEKVLDKMLRQWSWITNTSSLDLCISLPTMLGKSTQVTQFFLFFGKTPTLLLEISFEMVVFVARSTCVMKHVLLMKERRIYLKRLEVRKFHTWC